MEGSLADRRQRPGRHHRHDHLVHVDHRRPSGRHPAAGTRPGRRRRPAAPPDRDLDPTRAVGWSSSPRRCHRRDHRRTVGARCRAGRSPTRRQAGRRPTDRSDRPGARPPAPPGWMGVGLVGVAGQQVPQPRLVGDDPDRLGSADRDRILIPVVGQTLRDPVHQRQERGRISGVDPSHQGAQPVTGLGGPHIPLRRRPRRALLVGLLIDLQQGGVEQLLEPAPGRAARPARSRSGPRPAPTPRSAPRCGGRSRGPSTPTPPRP